MPAMIVKRSGSGYEHTVSSLLEAIERRGLSVFARVDHAAGGRSPDPATASG
jgi:uncharacterized protein (DUF302 family)